MKSNKGITLISLTVTIILIIILAGTITYSGIHVYENMRLENFTAEMKIIQDKVNLICDKYKVSDKYSVSDESKINDYLEAEGIKKISDNVKDFNDLGLNDEKKEKIVALLDSDESIDDYLYYNKELLDNNLGLKDLDQEVLINFETRKVISLKGVRYNNQIYYTQYDLPYGDETIKYKPNEEELNIIIQKKIYGLNATLDVKLNQETNLVKVYYGEKIGTDENNKPLVTYWTEIFKNSSNIYEINITKTADYAIKASINGKDVYEEENVTLVNPPNVSSKLIPIRYSDGTWYITDENSGNWYDYKPTDSKWANAMLSDGRYKIVNGEILDTKNGDEKKEVKNGIPVADEELGSMFVWIPRYMYQIEEGKDESGNVIAHSGFNTSGTGNINIKFLKGNTNIPTDNSNITNINISSVPGNGKWLVHPAFQDGSVNGSDFLNGEWDEEITGIWVAKFETSKTTNSEGKEVYKVCAGVKAESNEIFSNMFTKMKQFQRELNSHLMKNSEYGATVYLAHSIYGRNKQDITIDESLNTEKLTGYDYKNETSYSNTTTGNIYGIYDLNGVLPEVMSSILKSENINEILPTDNIRSSKYITFYDKNIDSNKYGDSIAETSDTSHEVSGECKSWYENTSKYVNEGKPIFMRNASTGLFGYECINVTDEDNISTSEPFSSRIVLILN